MAMPLFFFAWADKDTTFSPALEREDEQVFAFTLDQAEGDFASLEIDLRNPRIGLLAPTRKQWAWLSYQKTTGDVVPLFFGRLIGVPQDMQNEIVRLSFVARPADFEAQRDALAASLRVAPYYDPIFFSEDEQGDPDRVLEARSSLWHIDRVTGEVTVSDIITGEDGLLSFGTGEAFYDSVSVRYSQSPASRCEVTATVNWSQLGSGDIDVTNQIRAAFAALTISGITAVDGASRPRAGSVSIVTGEKMIANWPKFGASIGGGWTVGASYARIIGEPPLPPILVGNLAAMDAVRHWNEFPGSQSALREIFDRSPGFVVEIEDTTKPWADGGWLAHGDVNVMWLPVWQIGVGLKLHWDASRSYTETLTFTVLADVQPLLTDPGEEETIQLTYGPAEVDPYIGDRRNNRYFLTDRGGQSFSFMAAAARAHLLARARAIDVSFSVPFERGLDFTLRKSAVITDARLPGGEAAGKIKAYTLSADGDEGALSAALTIGCTIGRDGSITEQRGDPSYVEDGYVEDGYQVLDGEITVPFAGDFGYRLGDYAADDDGVNLYSIRREAFLRSLSVSGGLDEQKEAVATGGIASSTVGVVDRINGVKTDVSITLNPVTGGPFETSVIPAYISDLKVPRTIDLE